MILIINLFDKYKFQIIEICLIFLCQTTKGLKMKKIVLLGLCLIINVTYGSTPTESKINIENVYVPQGYDSNDNVEIVVEGYLPNLCHKSPKVKVDKISNKINLTLTSLYYTNDNYFCPPAVVPFLITVDLGVLNTGEYLIENNNHQKKLNVAKAISENVDNFIYANIEYLEKNYQEQSVVKLKGYNVSDCFELDRVELSTNKSDTVIILPIMKQVREFCPRKMTPFEYEVEVPKMVGRKKVLLHVRTMNGKSVNKLLVNH